MLQLPNIMPQLGESIAEATVIGFLVKAGERVEADQDVLEVETNKATMNVTSPGPGRIIKFLVNLNESYPVGAVLGYLEVSKAEAARHGISDSSSVAIAENGGAEGNGKQSGAKRKAVEPTVRGLPVPAHASGASYMSPRMKARMHELGLHAADLAGIAGSGAAGRGTIQDFEKFISNLEKSKLSHASSMRVAVADAMRRSWRRPLGSVAPPGGIEGVAADRQKAEA